MERNVGNGALKALAVDGKQKSGNGLKIVTVVACAVAICSIGFGIYGTIQSSQKDRQIAD